MKTNIKNTTEYTGFIDLFFDYINQNNLVLSPSQASELLRYSICKVLGLEASQKLEGHDTDIYRLVQLFKSHCNSNHIFEKDIKYKQGLLEACIHYFETARKKVEK